MNRPIMLLLTVIQIWNIYLKFQLNRVVYLCLCSICTKFQVDTSFLSWVLFNNLTSICSIWQLPWNHSTNIFIRIFLFHRIHWSRCWKGQQHWEGGFDGLLKSVWYDWPQHPHWEIYPFESPQIYRPLLVWLCQQPIPMHSLQSSNLRIQSSQWRSSSRH